ncbi:MAG: PDZ domain-containing protein [Gemmatimonadetes bacterium]|nr:PDZ domain-containing protein [Gemmatimonadota bacterium]
MRSRLAVNGHVVALLILGAAHLGAQTVCDDDGRRPAPQPGFGLLQCVGGACDIYGGTPSAPEHRFTVEPRVWRIAHPGPADGVLEEGDQLVAVDGAPITTRRAGQRLAQLSAQTPLTLTVRRAGLTRSVRLQPAVGCNYPMLVVTETSQLPAELTRPAHARPRGGTTVDAPFELGITLACGDCRWIRRYDGGLEWQTLEVPRVVAITPDGPASRSALAVGDQLLTVDGRVMMSEAGARYLGSLRPGQRVVIGYAHGTEIRTTTLSTGAPRTTR